jgi:hypothetical protein
VTIGGDDLRGIEGRDRLPAAAVHPLVIDVQPERLRPLDSVRRAEFDLHHVNLVYDDLKLFKHYNNLLAPAGGIEKRVNTRPYYTYGKIGTAAERLLSITPGIPPSHFDVRSVRILGMLRPRTLGPVVG